MVLFIRGSWWRAGLQAHAAAAFLLGASLAPRVRAETVAVVPVKGASDDGVALAREVRAALAASAAPPVLQSAELIAQRMRGDASFPSELFEERLAAAEQAFAELEHERSVALLESLITDLASDPRPTPEKIRLLHDARVRCAERLVGIAGPFETGKATTKAGARAREHLASMLRADPTFTLPADRYSPKLRGLLSGAADGMKAAGLQGIQVSSTPSQATVFLEGRVIGTTPLRLANTLLPGRYRVWVEGNGGRSRAQMVTVARNSQPVHIDLGVEGALWAEGPGIEPLARAPIDEDAARRLAVLLGADRVLFVGVIEQDGARWLWGAALLGKSTAVDGADLSRLSRRGAVRADAGAGVLARFLLGQDEPGVESRPLPEDILPSRDVAAAVAPEEGAFWWLGVGLAVGGAAALAGGVVGVLLLTRSVEGTLAVSVVEAP